MSRHFSPPRAITRLFLGLVSFLILVNTAAAQQSPPASTSVPPDRRVTRPFPPPQYIPPHDYDQRNIKLDLRFDWEQEQAIGAATLTLATTVKDLRRVDFDAAFMSVSSATLAGGA